MLWRWIAVLGMVSSVGLSGAQGQQQGQPGAPATTDTTEKEISTRSADTAIKVQANLVLVRVVVRDAGGKAVADLKQQDFQVLDNGKKRRISAFSVETAETQETNGPATVEGKATATEIAKGAAVNAGTGVVKASAMPKRFVALVFDDSHLKVADAMAVRAATKKLFAGLTPTDRVAIYSTTGNVQQDFTGDAETLRKTLAAIVPHPAKGEGQYKCPNITYYQADLIVNKRDREAILAAEVDARENDCRANIFTMANRILQAGDLVTRESYEHLENIVKHLAGMPGQRLLVYVSPGFIQGDAVLPDSWELIERAMRAGVVVNTIDARGLYTADMMPDMAAPPQTAPFEGTVDYQTMEGTLRMHAQFESGQVLAEMATSTGGTYFHNRNDLDLGMNQALEAPGVSYVLGFAPQNPKMDGKFHHLKVTLAKGKKYEIQARTGYYALKMPVDDPEEMGKQEVREALLSPDEVVSVPMKLETELNDLNATSPQLTVLTHLDIRGIRFRKMDGRSCNDVVLANGLFDANGQLVDGQMKEVALRLTDSTLESMSKTGLTIKIVFTVKPGKYRVRSVVRGSEGDQLTARNLMTVIPRKRFMLASTPGRTQTPATRDPSTRDSPVEAKSYVDCSLPELQKAVPQLHGLQPDPNQDQLPVLLTKAGKAVENLLQKTPNLLSREQVEQASEMEDGNSSNSKRLNYNRRRDFDYLILFQEDPVNLRTMLEEYRIDPQGRPIEPGVEDSRNSSSLGFGNAWLLFLPSEQSQSKFRYLGRQQIGDHGTFVMAFDAMPCQNIGTRSP